MGAGDQEPRTPVDSEGRPFETVPAPDPEFARQVINIGAAPPPTPGATITSQADAVVGIGATVVLTAPPAGTTRMVVQNTTVGNTRLRVREAGGAAGSGVLLLATGSSPYGSPGGAIATVEVEHVFGVAGTATIQFQGP